MANITVQVLRPFYVGTAAKAAGERVEVPKSFGLEMVSQNKARIVGDMPPAQPLASSDAAAEAIANDRKNKRA
jgi:hypothetical protein